MIVDAVWDDSADFNADYKDVVIDVISPQLIKLIETNVEVFKTTYVEAVMKIARNDDTKQFYMRKQAELGEDLYRVTTIGMFDSWLGYMYYCNNSEETIEQTLTLKFEGVEVLSHDVEQTEEG